MAFRSFASFPQEAEEPPTKKLRRSSKSRDKSTRTSITTATATTSTSTESNRLFFSDRKGDQLNLQLGRSSHVPKYSLAARGKRILGLPKGYSVSHRTVSTVEVGLDAFKHKASGLTDKQTRKLLNIPPRHHIVEPSPSSKYEENDGVILIPSKSNSKEPYGHPLSDVSDDSDSTSESDTQDHPQPYSYSYSQETLRSLEGRLSASPTSIHLWMDLLSESLTSIPPSTKNASHARAEVSISILSRCLEAHPNNALSTLVRLKLLACGEQVWHESKLKATWEDALKLRDPDIWMGWLNWNIRKPNTSVDAVVDTAKRAIASLHDDEIGRVRIIWRIAQVFHSNGLTERATALFQAQGELTFCVPDQFKTLPFPSLLDRLEDFWEAEQPRLGEKNALGWSSSLLSPKAGDESVQSTMSSTGPIRPQSSNLDKYQLWAQQESHQDSTSVFPSRSTDNSDDPFSTIFFTDLKELLIPLTTCKAKDAFRKAWIAFIGLPLPGFGVSLSNLDWDDKWCCTYLAHPSYLNTLVPPNESIFRQDYIHGISVGREQKRSSSFGTLQWWSYGIRRPLHSRIDGHGEGGSFWCEADLEGLPQDYIRQLFQSLRIGDLELDVEWDTLYVAFERLINPKQATKVSRKILSNNQNSMSHWGNHALLQRSCGKMEDARKIYNTVLSDPQSSQDLERGTLWWDWAEMEWLAGKKPEAMQVILKAVGISGDGGVAVLRAKRAIAECIGNSTHWKIRESWINLHALLELLSSQDPSASMTVFDQWLSSSRDQGIFHESLLFSSLSMLYRHTMVLKHPYPPSVLHSRAQNALDSYPDNSLFLGFLLESEKGFGIINNLQIVKPQSNDVSKSLGNRIEELWMASWRAGHWMYQVEKMRVNIMTGLEDSRLQGSPILWRVAIEVEIRAGELKRAKTLLYRALSECPLVKSLYLLAFGVLKPCFEKYELAEFRDRMTELLRLREGFEEIPMDDETVSDQGTDSDSDEIVERAQEMKKLMPF